MRSSLFIVISSLLVSLIGSLEAAQLPVQANEALIKNIYQQNDNEKLLLVDDDLTRQGSTPALPEIVKVSKGPDGERPKRPLPPREPIKDNWNIQAMTTSPPIAWGDVLDKLQRQTTPASGIYDGDKKAGGGVLSPVVITLIVGIVLVIVCSLLYYIFFVRSSGGLQGGANYKSTLQKSPNAASPAYKSTLQKLKSKRKSGVGSPKFAKSVSSIGSRKSVAKSKKSKRAIRK